MAAQAPFALAPALVGAANNELIDYSTRTGQGLYRDAIEAFPYLFQGRNSSIATWLHAASDRASVCGWTDVLAISVGQDANGNDIFKNLLTEHGQITLQNVRENALQDYIGQENRNAQMATQIYLAARKSISDNVYERMVTETSNFTINGVPDGPSFIMTLIDLYQVQTRGTATQLRLELAKAPIRIVEQSYDIDAFNNGIDTVVQRLSANGETTEDLFAHLTKAYKKVPDKAFAAYMNNKIDDHNDGTAPLSSSELMSFAKRKFEEISSEGGWMLGSTETELIALTAQLEQVKLENHRLQRHAPARGAFPHNNAGPANKARPRTPRAETGKDKWAWKSQKPKPGQSTRQFEGKTYHWCRYHKKWTLHQSEECRLARQQPAKANHGGPVAMQAVLEPMDPFDDE